MLAGNMQSVTNFIHNAERWQTGCELSARVRISYQIDHCRPTSQVNREGDPQQKDADRRRPRPRRRAAAAADSRGDPRGLVAASRRPVSVQRLCSNVQHHAIRENATMLLHSGLTWH